MSYRRTAALVTCLGGLAVAAPAEAATATQADLSRAAVRAVARTDSPGALVLARDGRRTTRVAAGSATLQPRAKASPRDRFRAGSVTKSFVAASLLQLAAKGRLSLEDSVERWLPGTLPNGAAITLRQLLNLTSGLADYLTDPRVNAPLRTDPAHVFAPSELASIAASIPSTAAPGTQWSYSNTNYLLLGLIVEKAAGRPLTAVLRDGIFKPLKLTHTALKSSPRIPGSSLTGYGPGKGGALTALSGYSPSFAWAAGALVSTTQDLATFYAALMDGKVVPRSQLAQMRTIAPLSRTPATGYGLGLLRLKTRCGSAWGHDGEVLGTSTLAVSSRSGSRQAVVVLNRTGLTTKQRAEQLRLLDTAYCGASA